MILIDTGAVYALVDKNDLNHLKAKNFYEKVIDKESLCICLPVLTEAWLLIDARLGTYFANKVWKAVIDGVFDILQVDIEDMNLAFEIERKYEKAGFGFVDSLCFALCERYKIKKVFTFDKKHFSIYKPSFSKALEILP